MTIPGAGGQTPPRPDQAYQGGGGVVIAPGSTQVIRALQVIVSGTGAGVGVFVYSGTPALGNPPIFTVVAPGTTKDPFGNTVQPLVNIGLLTGSHVGFDSSGVEYLSDPGGVTRIMIDPQNRVIEFFDSLGTGHNAALMTVASAAGTDRFTGLAFPAGINLPGLPLLAGNAIINSSGEFLYSGTPALGNLINSLASAAGNDPSGNAVPQGLMSQQLTLVNQASAPPSFTGASVMYSSTAGRPRYKSSAGADNVIERADINVSQFTQGNSTVPAPVSAAVSYLGGEGNQGSEYEIEIDGIITTASAGATNTVTFQLDVDGSDIGAEFTLGAVFLTVGSTWSYSVRFRLALLTTGAGGTCFVASDGQVSHQGVNAGSSTSPVPTVAVGANSGGLVKSFDSTSSHTIQAYAFWGGVNAGQQITTYLTRLTRRF